MLPPTRFSPDEQGGAAERILFTCTQPEFAALPLVQIVPILADRGLHIGSERRFFWVLNDKSQVYLSGRAKPPQQSRDPFTGFSS
jgi:putative transposase